MSSAADEGFFPSGGGGSTPGGGGGGITVSSSMLSSTSLDARQPAPCRVADRGVISVRVHKPAAFLRACRSLLARDGVPRPSVGVIAGRRRVAKMMAAASTRMQNLLRLYLSLQASDNFLGLGDEPSLRFASISAATRGASSSIHGQGLFAAQSLPAGSVATLYPAHALGDAERRFEADGVSATFGGTEHKPYRLALPPAPSLLEWGEWARDLWIDVDPSLATASAWSGHLVNDAAMCPSSCTEADVLDYYAQSSRANCRLVAFGDTPFVAHVLTSDVEAGTELCGMYGHDYWCAFHTGQVPTYGADVTEAEEAWSEASREWRKVVQAEYTDEIAAVQELVELTVVDSVPPEMVAFEGRDGSELPSGKREGRVREGVTLRVPRRGRRTDPESDSEVR